MKFVGWALVVLVVALLVAATGQHLRYLGIRRDVVGDRQPVLHSSSAFHVVTMLELSPDQDLLDAVRELVLASEQAGATVVYAGKVAVNALESRQIPPAQWDALVVAQYPSREAYDAVAADPAYRRLRDRFASSYAMGMRRSPWVNAGLPILLMGLRAIDLVRGTPSGYPFTRANVAAATEEMRIDRTRAVEGLLGNIEYGKDAVVVVNFIKKGSAAEQEANAGYGRAMLGLMAELGYGPMHLGDAVVVEGDADFDQVVIVFYPGVEFFADMVQSEFFTSIIGGKQLGDSLASPTVPILARL